MAPTPPNDDRAAKRARGDPETEGPPLLFNNSLFNNNEADVPGPTDGSPLMQKPVGLDDLTTLERSRGLDATQTHDPATLHPTTLSILRKQVMRTRHNSNTMAFTNEPTNVDASNLAIYIWIKKEDIKLPGGDDGAVPHTLQDTHYLKPDGTDQISFIDRLQVEVASMLDKIVPKFSNITSLAFPRGYNKGKSTMVLGMLFLNEIPQDRSALEQLRRLRIALAKADAPSSTHPRSGRSHYTIHPLTATPTHDTRKRTSLPLLQLCQPGSSAYNQYHALTAGTRKIVLQHIMLMPSPGHTYVETQPLVMFIRSRNRINLYPNVDDYLAQLVDVQRSVEDNLFTAFSGGQFSHGNSLQHLEVMKSHVISSSASQAKLRLTTNTKTDLATMLLTRAPMRMTIAGVDCEVVFDTGFVNDGECWKLWRHGVAVVIVLTPPPAWRTSSFAAHAIMPFTYPPDTPDEISRFTERNVMSDVSGALEKLAGAPVPLIQVPGIPGMQRSPASMRSQERLHYIVYCRSGQQLMPKLLTMSNTNMNLSDITLDRQHSGAQISAAFLPHDIASTDAAAPLAVSYSHGFPIRYNKLAVQNPTVSFTGVSRTAATATSKAQDTAQHGARALSMAGVNRSIYGGAPQPGWLRVAPQQDPNPDVPDVWYAHPRLRHACSTPQFRTYGSVDSTQYCTRYRDAPYLERRDTRPKPFVQHQRAAQCLLHAVNNCAGHPALEFALMQAVLSPHEQVGNVDPAGWFHAGQLSKFLQVTNVGLKLHEGSNHDGPNGATWARTIQSQQHTGIDCAVLMLRPSQDQRDNPHAKTHAVAAVKLAVNNMAPAWYLIDSVTPTRLYKLDDPQCYSALDADVMYFTLAENGQAQSSRAANARAIRENFMRLEVRQVSPHSNAVVQGRLSWPGARPILTDNFVREPVVVMLFAPSSVLLNRSLFLKVCGCVGLQLLSFAKFTYQKGVRNETAHLCLTITQQSHLQQIETAWEDASTAIKHHTGWRITRKTNPAAPNTPPTPVTYTSPNEFAPLALADTPINRTEHTSPTTRKQQPRQPPQQEQQTCHRPKSRTRLGTAEHPRLDNRKRSAQTTCSHTGAGHASDRNLSAARNPPCRTPASPAHGPTIYVLWHRSNAAAQRALRRLRLPCT